MAIPTLTYFHAAVDGFVETPALAVVDLVGSMCALAAGLGARSGRRWTPWALLSWATVTEIHRVVLFMLIPPRPSLVSIGVSEAMMAVAWVGLTLGLQLLIRTRAARDARDDETAIF